MSTAADVERAALLTAPSSSSCLAPSSHQQQQQQPRFIRSFGDSNAGRSSSPAAEQTAATATTTTTTDVLLRPLSSGHVPLMTSSSMPVPLSRSPSASNLPNQQSTSGAPPPLPPPMQRYGANTSIRPKLRGGGGHLAGVRLYRQRTAASEEAGPSPVPGRTHSVFSNRSGGLPSANKDRGSLRYRRIQNKIYNILERPKDCRAITYHVLSFAVVFACLVLSIVQSADDSINLLNEISMSVELLMLLWFTSEYVLRIWSAGCRSKYQSFTGRLRFARRPLCIIDAIVIIASVIVVVMNASSRISQAATTMLDEGASDIIDPTAGGGNMVPALRGLRFFQIMRMMRLDRRGSSWRLLSSVVWAHRQELFTAIYTGFLVLIFASFAMYVAERETNEKQFKSYADALWWGVITLCTVGYGDKVPQTAIGRVIGSCCAMIGISFFALPPGILGSGLALKVQQQQRQKHQIRRRMPAAMLIQALWRMVGTDPGTVLTSTWHFYIAHQRRTKQLLGSGIPAQLSWAPASVTDRLQLAAGRLVNVSRRSFKDRDRDREGSQSPPPGITLRQYHHPVPRSPDSSPSDQSPTGPLTTAQCNVIRAVRRMKFLVCRRKLRESMRPYDVKDVIEQYSSGHAEILSRLRQLQYRMDDVVMTVAPARQRTTASLLVGGGALGVGGPASFSGMSDSPVQRQTVPPPGIEEEQSLEWRMNLLDRKLDLMLELFSASQVAGASSVAPQLAPAIVVSTATTGSTGNSTPLVTIAEINQQRVHLLQQQQYRKPQKDQAESSSTIRRPSAELLMTVDDDDEVRSIPSPFNLATVDSTRPSSSADDVVFSGIVVDNESKV